ncbi:hypothetical protein ADU59_25350 [Pararhizobium polonicum]|uniref:Uncharacterized protein n=1 Tax=Pararhizobium polonicum TaxID=1612624 RepID=A0A1C7NUW7_9HYPH|nr:hypothetical protein [Pararhizobium polonicum]OBZ92791.1 hypothetical protein ADU59_25350 [Pararhizobium polonicum]
MEHIAAIMMLVGCAQGNIECKELPAPAVGFETAEECRQLLQPSINDARGHYRIVYGTCTEIDPALYLEDATITWDITPSDQLDVQVTFDDPALPVVVAQQSGHKAALSN